MATAVAGFALLTSAACADSSVGPGNSPLGYYRLSSVNGTPVPYVTLLQLIRNGAMVMHANNEVRFAIHNAAGDAVMFQGRHSISGDSIFFSAPGFSTIAGIVGGDSIKFELPILFLTNVPVVLRTTFVFRKSTPDPVAVKSGTYLMMHDGYRAIGGPPEDGQRLDYDSLIFIDGVFFRRSSRMSLYVNGAEVAYVRNSRYGTYSGNRSYLLLREISDASFERTFPTRDSLIVQNNVLIRRLWNADRVADQRYELRP